MNAPEILDLDRSPAWHFVPRSQKRRLSQSSTVIHQARDLPAFPDAPESFAREWLDSLHNDRDPSALTPLRGPSHQNFSNKDFALELPAEGIFSSQHIIPRAASIAADFRWSAVSGIANHRLDFFLEENADLLVIIDATSRPGAFDVDAAQILHLRFYQRNLSRVRVLCVAAQPFGLLNIRAELLGANASFDLRYLNLGYLQGQDHLYSEIHHKAPDCRSDQLIRSALGSGSLCTVDSSVLIPPHIQNSVAHQLINHLLLSANAKAISKPTLLIYNDAVEASHGNTCGSLDPQSLFYCMSRGMSAAQAQSVLLRAFIAEVWSGYEHPALHLLRQRALNQDFWV